MEGPNYKKTASFDYGKLKKKQQPILQNLTAPHVESFNYVIHEGLPKAVENLLPVEFALPNGDQIKLQILDVSISSPTVAEKSVKARTLKLYPAECRGRGTSYSGALNIQLGFSVNGVSGPPLHRTLGQVPVMVKSDVCNLSKMSPKELVEHGEEAEEMGGYFIVNGMERVVRCLILPRRNFPIAISRNSWKKRGKLFSEYGVQMKCVRQDQSAISTVLHYLNDGTAILNINFSKEMFFVPLIIILKGLVSVSDKYIYNELIKGKEDDSFYKGCIVSMLRQALAENLTTRREVLTYVGKRFRVKLHLPDWYTDEEVGIFLYKQCVCVHLSNDTDKFNLLVYMTQKLFDFAKGKCAEEGGDNPMNHELLLSGHFYLMVLKEKLESYLISLRGNIERNARTHKAGQERYQLTPDSLLFASRHAIDISVGMHYLLATGNLVSKSGLGLMQDKGLSILADKLNMLRYISHFRSVHRGAFFTEMRTTSVRRLLPEAWGFICPVHTPDGSPCGLLNHMTALCQVVTTPYDTTALIKQLYSLDVSLPDVQSGWSVKDSHAVLLDGKVVGFLKADKMKCVADKLRVMKVKGQNKVPDTLEIVYVPKTEFASQHPGLYLFSTPARMVRPVWNLALDHMEMIGTFEQVYLDICVNENEAHPGVTTHREVNEVSMLSFLANLTPFSDFNQSPRNMYQCQMGKQTMGTPLHSWKYRCDNKLYRLQTPQTPTVRPIKYDQYDIDSYPNGTNAIVAVISYTGYDMEDAMVINKSSLERGFCHASIYKAELINLNTMENKSEANTLMFGCPPQHKHVISGRLDVDGFPAIGMLLKEGDPFYSYINLQTSETRVKAYKSKEAGYVDNIKILGNNTGTGHLQKVAIMLRINRNPVIGDKFASRHGQKGVCSMMYPVENMPFTESGMTPDIIFNPHGFPSRMTIGMMIESMAGKSATSHGLCHDATPFMFSEDEPAIDHFGHLLVAAGYNYYGTERFYSGIDGREMEANIFMGVVYYQRLRHMVSDKFQVRTTGPVDMITHQPVKGRKRAGGVRFGEMERDALISHGTSFLLHDRLVNCSDGSVARVCTKCGSLLSPLLESPASANAPVYNEKHKEWTCKVCQLSDTVQVIAVPYVFRYLVAELAAMNIKVQLDVQRCDGAADTATDTVVDNVGIKMVPDCAATCDAGKRETPDAGIRNP